MDPRRRIAQPGPPAAERIQFVEGRGVALEFDLEPGLDLLEAVRRPLAAIGRSSAALQLQGGAFGPLVYAMPALSPTPEHAAFYSEFFRPGGRRRIAYASATLGVKDDTPILHCHGIWIQADGGRRGGHVIPNETFIIEPVRARAWALDGMGFEARPDAETNFTLLGPVPRRALGDGRASGRFFALRLCPNQDICFALEQFCRERRIAAAELRGGVASIIGAVFDDGREVEPFATEMFICSGRIATSSGGVPEASLDVALVDYTGGLAEGRLRRGANPVLMTVEVVLEAVA
jgi:predicted DNA-binding protein with PD1-like motif